MSRRLPGTEPRERPEVLSGSANLSAGARAAELRISVVVPMYDEEGNVELLHREITDALRRITSNYELIFVDDGSRDRTLERLRSLCAQDPHMTVLRFTRNYGQTAALQAGFDHAKGEVVVTMDGDLQNDPADTALLLDKLGEGYDIVSGWRRSRQEVFMTRRLPSMVANWLIARLTGARIHDNGCTMKAYRLQVVKKAQLYSEMHRFLVPMLSLSGHMISEVEVSHRPRRFGRSKYGLSRIWKVLLDMVAVKMLLRFASHPAAWFAVLAFPFLLVSLFAAGASAFLYAAPDASRELPPVVLPSISLLAAFTAIHLLLLGMLAELVVRVGDHRESENLLIDLVTRESA